MSIFSEIYVIIRAQVKL